MGAFAAYTFVAGIVLAAAYLIYQWLLSGENQPTFNRAVLLSVYALAFLSPPLLALGGAASASGAAGAITLGEVGATLADTPHGGSTFIEILLWIYLAGMIATALWTLAGVVKITRLVASGEKVREEHCTIVLLDRADIAPFSWGRYVVMSRNEDADAASIILCHEKAHIGLRHFADLLLAQAVCIVLWYNPASWLMISALKSVHEYQADSRVLATGISPRQYQMFLIQKAIGVRFQSLANSLNHSNLKQRITMMYNRKSSAWRRSRALAVVPAVALAFALMQIPSVSHAIDAAASTSLTVSAAPSATGKVSKTAAKKQTAAQTPTDHPEVLPKFPGGEVAMMRYLMENVKYPEAAINDSIQGRVVLRMTIGTDGSVGDIEVLRPVDPRLDAEAIRVVKSMPRFTPGESHGEKVACNYVLPIYFSLK